jgi:hypothetical protein
VPVAMRLPLALFVVLCFTACGKSAEKKMQEKLKAEEARKAEQKKKDEEADAKRFAPAAADKVMLPSPYNDSDSTMISNEGPCPEGLWSLFKGDTPGENKEEKKANEAKRAELAKALKDKTFLVKLRAPDDVSLKDFNAPKGEFPLEVLGSVDCTDSFGHVTLAWTAAKAGDPGNSAAKQDAEVTQRYWLAPKVTFAIPMKTMGEAKEWASANKISMKARVVFKLGKVEVDKKIHKVAKVAEKVGGETISLGGGDEDWGAGRMVHAELVGLRVATNKEKDQLFEKKGDGK